MEYILYAMRYEASPTSTHPPNELHLKLSRPHRQENNISYTIPFSHDHILQPNNTHFRELTNFYLTFHDIDEATSGTLINNLTNFIEAAIHSFGTDNLQPLKVIFEIEDNNPNATTRLDVEVTIQHLGIQQRQATKEEEGECSICLQELYGLQHINTLSCNHIFHHECISTWLRHRTTCPNCRTQIV